MSTTVPLRIERPYDSEESYLEGDAWTVERSDMVLCGAAELPPGTAVAFEIALSTGVVVVRGEGRVVEPVAPSGDRPGGMRVRFRKLDGDSKGVLKRALEVQRRSAAGPSIARAPRPPNAELDGERPSSSTASAPIAAPVSERSGVRHAVPGPVEAPANREALLGRLRERARRGTAAE